MAEVARGLGTEAYLVQSKQDLDPAWLKGKSKIGITSGASTPEILVQELVDELRAHGALSVEKFSVTEENLVFHLPRNLAEAVEGSGRSDELLSRYGRVARTP